MAKGVQTFSRLNLVTAIASVPALALGIPSVGAESCASEASRLS